MKIEPMANNKIFITTNNGICISISDDGNTVSIKREINFDHTGGMLIKGNFYTYQEHHEQDIEHQINADIIRIEK